MKQYFSVFLLFMLFGVFPIILFCFNIVGVYAALLIPLALMLITYYLCFIKKDLVINIKESIFSIFYIFKQVISANLDLIYILSAFKVIQAIFKDRNFIKTSVKYFAPIVMWAIIQIATQNVDIVRLLVNVSKIYLCIIGFLYVKENFGNLKIKAIIMYTSLLFTVLLPISLTYKTELFWRLNDLVNMYSQTRLRLFYTEPSELAFYISIILIFLSYYFLAEKNKKINLFLILILGYELSLSSGLNGLVGLVGSIFLMLVVNFHQKVNPKNFVKYYVASALIIGIGLTIILRSETIMGRINDVIQGNDGSVNYRVQIGYLTMKNALVNSHLIGVGFGNSNTDMFQYIYSSYGIKDVIANSFMYFITEGGVFAIIYLITFYVLTLRGINKQNILLKLPLLMFIIYYQIGGGYFTNPINWIVCGIIASESQHIVT
ncbi:hypothetical protein CSC2_44930 [Clostridium zeae]|uniref:O-antigen ligase domain-containing protein n=1 Tax=Clostridium zeae TaxID=2759022 RepID=A0ABQ1EGL9_9CLOT|nr:hypothetical protein [Clostridium zeae]GFZ33967.1 hypothetical protein CSC2_44930 [Clostridium zeae]